MKRIVNYEAIPFPAFLHRILEPWPVEEDVAVNEDIRNEAGARVRLVGSSQPIQGPSEADIEELVAMGFAREQVIVALRSSNNNKLQAVERLLGN